MESKGRERYYLPQISTEEERKAAKEAKDQDIGIIVFLALIAAIFFLSGVLICYLIFGTPHLRPN